MFRVFKKALDISELSFLHAYNSSLIKTLNPLCLYQGYSLLVTKACIVALAVMSWSRLFDI